MKLRYSSALSHDVPLFLILIPIINVLTYYLTYTHITLTWHLPLTFLIDTLEGYAAWYVARSIIRYLDGCFPYSRNPLSRVALQCVLTSLAGISVIILLTELVNFLATDASVPSSFYSFAIFIFLIWMLVVNGIYVGLHYYGAYQRAEQQRVEATRIRAEGVTVQSGRQTVRVPFGEIAGFYVDGDYVMVSGHNGSRYVVSQSLDTLEAQLPAEWFFRLNRQFTLHRDEIIGFDRLENGKVAARLRSLPHFPDQVMVSRTKAPSFKRWFGEGAEANLTVQE